MVMVTERQKNLMRKHLHVYLSLAVFFFSTSLDTTNTLANVLLRRKARQQVDAGFITFETTALPVRRSYAGYSQYRIC
ncbi:uncharacterized protein F4812DRAFT_435798 [Daldinia caldariorum]|uniref:uncharacterized protein n=1 Tax=Daldinia caldariorum TaxID=326644 RepID=UPI002007DB20|nr:uncharacterized protein F4812DRAFT_435798 [Daldinia caldariorum]KAI1466064.1 hypothetical protein F4812DRAFT_435798 [Daldinia caldariorum]